SRPGRGAMIPDEPESEGYRAQVDASPQEKRNLPPERDRDDRGRRHPKDDAGVAEGRLEPHRPIELQPLELAANPGDPDRVIEARSDSREGNEEQQHPEGRGQGDQGGAESEDDDSEREEPRRVPTIRHRAEDHLKDGGHEERGAAEEAGLEGAE